jgi:hypothetical protein
MSCDVCPSNKLMLEHGDWFIWCLFPFPFSQISHGHKSKTSFTLIEPVSLVKVFRLFRLEQIVLVFRMSTEYVDVQHLLYWQDERVCDALFSCGWKETCQVHIPTSLFCQVAFSQLWIQITKKGIPRNFFRIQISIFKFK